MMDAATGWAVEGRVGDISAYRILRTTDGGETWRDVSPTWQSPNFGRPFLLDAHLAWAWVWDGLTTRQLWRTQDAGLSWSPVGRKDGYASWVDIWFNDSQHGWKMEAELWGLSFQQFDITSFATTQDAGQTWDEVKPPPDGGPAFLAFADAQTAWGIRAGFANSPKGYPNLIVPFLLETTTDGGRTWRSQTVPLPPGAKKVFSKETGGDWLDAGNCNFDVPVYSSTTVWKLALTCEDQGWVYTTLNQGKTWMISPLPAGQVTAIQFITPKIGWLLGGDKRNRSQRLLYQTQDGGQTWALLKRTPWADAQLDFLDSHSGWAVASACTHADCNPYQYANSLVKTTDGGQTWRVLQASVVP